ncbi:MAG: universal stress protein [Candidatus Angelobacter sp.]
MAAPLLITPTSPKLKNLLFTTDFSTGSLAALPYATRIARAFGANLHLCHIEPTAPLATGLADLHLYEAAGKEAAQHLAALRDLPELRGLKPALVLAEGDFKNELMKVVSAANIDLVVAGTRGRTGLRKMLLGSVTEEICRAVTCPILTVGPDAAYTADGPFQRILFPTNLSELSQKTVPYIAMLAREFAASITILHVLPADEATTSDEKALTESVRRKMIDEFSALAALQPEFVVAMGDTAETVLRVAREKKAGLIAMGIRNAFRPGILRERTAYRIIAGAQCPVLTVR